jgi:hypothetical protein
VPLKRPHGIGILLVSDSFEAVNKFASTPCGKYNSKTTKHSLQVSAAHDQPKCNGTMAVIAIIEDEDELDKIIKWYSKQVSEAAGARAPPLLTKV